MKRPEGSSQNEGKGQQRPLSAGQQHHILSGFSADDGSKRCPDFHAWLINLLLKYHSVGLSFTFGGFWSFHLYKRIRSELVVLTTSDRGQQPIGTGLGED